MGTESYKDWLSLYTENLDTIWKQVPKELRKLAMLSAAYESESNKLSNNLKSEMNILQSKIKMKKDMEVEYISFSSTSKNSKDSIYATPNASSVSPDSINFVKNPSGKDDLCLSPVLSKSKKSPSPKMGSKSQPTVFKTPDLFGSKSRGISSSDDDFDNCIIECTPNAKPVKSISKLSTNKKGKESFSYLKKKSSISKFLTSLDSNSVNKSNNCNDTTFVEDGIWRLGEGKENKSKVPSPVLCSSKSKNEDSRLKEIDNDKIRGKARKMLPGWSCKDCEMLYELMDLSEEEKIKKMNECSRHRYKFGPQEDTIDGYWDMNMDTQK